jgi:hypothetical protein
MRFTVDEAALGQVFLASSSGFLLLIIPLLLHNHLSLPPEVCDNPDWAAHYHILSP